MIVTFVSTNIQWSQATATERPHKDTEMTDRPLQTRAQRDPTPDTCSLLQ
jgi:hypothetical protein